jgi:hypothetical protein
MQGFITLKLYIFLQTYNVQMMFFVVLDEM